MSNYPPGAENDPYAPWNQPDEPCAICEWDPSHCRCPECPVCGVIGNPDCADEHGHDFDPAPSPEAVHEMQMEYRYEEYRDRMHDLDQ